MSFVKSGTVLFLASMAGNFCNYLFQFFMSRSLELTDYGAMNAALSLTSILGIPAGTIMLVVARYSSTFNAKGDSGMVGRLYRGSLLFTSCAGAALCAVLIAASAAVASYLKLEGAAPIIIVGAGLALSFAMAVNMGMLQGLQRFWHLSAAIGLGAASKLILGVLFVLLGLGLNGAVAATALPGLFVMALTIFPLARYLKKGRGAKGAAPEVAAYSVPVLVSALAFTAMTNLDMITVKHWASPGEAGLYSAVSVLGKTILYLPAAFVLALFPMISDSHARKGDIYRVLDKALLVTTGFSAAGVLGLALFPELAISMLFGAKFAAAAPLLKYYGLAMISMAVVSVLVTFNLARGATGFIYSLAAGTMALAVLFHLLEGSLLSTVLAMAAVNAAVASYNLFTVMRGRRAWDVLRLGAQGRGAA
ncbi:MAG TPA: oligosaccharide flippase family protein [Thermodesulfobacteriota bacterium]